MLEVRLPVELTAVQQLLHRRIAEEQQLGVDLGQVAEAAAGRARAPRTVEREKPRLDLGDRYSAVAAGVLGVVHRFFVVGESYDHAVGQLDSGLYRIGEPLLYVGLDN